jgi:DNA-3-methyladenine glycosylase
LLIGVRLVRADALGRREARIVETEAYAGPEDRASHARFGSTRRNRVMAGPPGHAYVYLVYGMYDCLNVVTGPAGSPGAVLVRAVEPMAGSELMRADRLAVERRRRSVRTDAGRTAAEDRLRRTPHEALGRGPGLVGACFGVDPSWTGTDLCDDHSSLRLESTPDDDVDGADIAVGARIGIGYAGDGWADRPWRFWIRDHPSVTRRR